jgi:hypothetical protein
MLSQRLCNLAAARIMHTNEGDFLLFCFVGSVLFFRVHFAYLANIDVGLHPLYHGFLPDSTHSKFGKMGCWGFKSTKVNRENLFAGVAERSSICYHQGVIQKITEGNYL